MATSVIKIGLQDLSHELAAREKVTRENVRAAQIDAALETQREVVRATPVDRGEMAASWVVKPGTGREPTELRNDAPHAGIIELGTRPYRPPFTPLFEWAKRKAGDLALGGMVKIGPQSFRRTKAGFLNYRGPKSLEEDDLDALRAFVYGIINRVARVGFKPHHVMKNKLPFAQQSLRRAVERRIAKTRGNRVTGNGSSPAK